MLKMSKGIFVVFVLCLYLSSIAAATLIQEKQVDTKKLYEEISGTYDFDMDGQVTVLIFYVKDGILYGTSEDDDEEVEILPVELEKLSFEATDMDGQFYEITFFRDEDDQVAKCVILTDGMEIEGIKR